MTDETDLERGKAAIDLVDRLLTRALLTIQGAPYWKYVDEPDYAFIEIEDDNCFVYWPSVDHAEELSGIEQGQASFPARLLFISSDEFSQWRAAEKKRYKDEKRARAQAAEVEEARTLEARERTLLANLKKKYEA